MVERKNDQKGKKPENTKNEESKTTQGESDSEEDTQIKMTS